MFDIFADFVERWFYCWLEVLQDMVNQMYDYALNADKYLANFIPSFSGIYSLIFKYAMLIIVIKFLAKGISTWVLWTDGDPDQDPVIMLTSFFKAMIGCLCFGELYSLFITVVRELLNKLINTSGFSITDISVMEIGWGSFLVYLAGLIDMIIIVCLNVKMRVTGLQLLVLRLGFPLAASGMLDADGGSYKPYIKVYIQIALTVIIQTLFINLSIFMLVKANSLGDMLNSLSCVIMALVTPAFLQQFVMQGGQLGQKISSGLMAMSSFKRMIH